MSTSTPPAKTYVRPRTIRLIGWAVHLVGAYLLIAGFAYAISAATQAPAWVRVPVVVTSTTAEMETGGFALTDRDERLDDVIASGEGNWITARDDAATFTLSSWGSTELEQFLSRGDGVILGLAAAIVSFLLQPVLTSLAGPRPFAHCNARRFAAMAITVLSAAVLHPVPPHLASGMVLQRLDHPASLAVPDLHLHLWPVLAVVVALLLLAEAFRQGERLDHEVEGLV